MLHELDSVVVLRDLPDHGLRAGDVGTIVLLHHDRGYEVEFMTLTGETLAVVSLPNDQVREIRPREIAQVRSVDAASSG
jgi:hypothetical protein